jgi:DNA polymerase III epsilon subunit-like protein
MSNLIFLDTETTGVRFPRLVELGFIQEGEEAITFRVKPPVPIEPGASAVNGITNEMVENCPTFNAYKDAVKELLETNIIVAHNANFDVQVLDYEGVHIRSYICTKKLARLLVDAGLIPKINLKLQTLRKQFGLEDEGIAHTAEGDNQVTRELFWRMAKVFSTWWDIPVDSPDLLERMVKEMNIEPETFNKTMKFGKFKGKDFEYISEADPSYFIWFIENGGDNFNNVVREMNAFITDKINKGEVMFDDKDKLVFSKKVSV